MAEDSKILLLPKYPSFVPKDQNLSYELQRIYDTINALTEQADTLVTAEDFTQDERAEYWLAGNVPNSKLATAARKLMRFSTDAVPGDLVRFTPGTDNAFVRVGSAIAGDPLGMCIDNVTAGSSAFVYIKGIVPFTKFALVPGRIYGTRNNPADGDTNAIYQTTSVDASASSNNTVIVGIAVSTNSILLQNNQFG